MFKRWITHPSNLGLGEHEKRLQMRCPLERRSNLGLDEHEKRLQIKRYYRSDIFLLLLVPISHSKENQFYLPSTKILMLEGVNTKSTEGSSTIQH